MVFVGSQLVEGLGRSLVPRPPFLREDPSHGGCAIEALPPSPRAKSVVKGKGWVLAGLEGSGNLLNLVRLEDIPLLEIVESAQLHPAFEPFADFAGIVFLAFE